MEVYCNGIHWTNCNRILMDIVVHHGIELIMSPTTCGIL